MKTIFESIAARLATGWQRAGAKFDFEVFALPGGSVLAPALWVYSMMLSALERFRSHSEAKEPAPGARTKRAHCSCMAH